MAQPNTLTVPFGSDADPGTINIIPITKPGSAPAQTASWSKGFPADTMKPIVSGGVPPNGQDFNGILLALSEHIVYQNRGGVYQWDDAAAPYNLGAVVQSNDGRSAYVSIVNGNSDNFNVTPAAIGVSWLPYAGAALAPNATTTVRGLVELATNGETQTGTDTQRAVTPAGMRSVTSTEARAGLIEIATTAEARSLSDDVRSLTPKKLLDIFTGSNQSLLSAGGYQRLPGGLIIQWGSVTIGASGNSTFVFPIAFPNNAFTVAAMYAGASTSGEINVCNIGSVTRSGGRAFIIDMSGAVGPTAGGWRYIAVGN